MATLLIFLLAWYHLYAATSSKILNIPPPAGSELGYLAESLDDLVDVGDAGHLNEIGPSMAGDRDNIPFVRTVNDLTEMHFRHPISSVNIDYLRNVIVLKFRKDSSKHHEPVSSEARAAEEENRKSLESNFMRFGKRAYEQMPSAPANDLESSFVSKQLSERSERSNEGLRDSRGDNFMRFGREPAASRDFMRFGRVADGFLRFGRRPAGQDFMRFGRGGPEDFMRFGRNPGQDFMRFGRNPSRDFMRFGRNPSRDFMHFGRNPSQDFMRFGRNPTDDFMRFGRSQKLVQQRQQQQQQDEFGKNFMRFGRTPPNNAESFMRFGKSVGEGEEKTNSTEPLLQKNEIKQTVKLIHESERSGDEGNPMDKAIKVLFQKHQQKQLQQPVAGWHEGDQYRRLRSSEEEQATDQGLRGSDVRAFETDYNLAK